MKKSNMKNKKKGSTKSNNQRGLQPLSDRVVVIAHIVEDKQSKSGLIIPETLAGKDKPDTGKVIAVGEGRMTEAGNRVKMSVKVGDIVLFSKYVPDEVKLDGQDLIILREDQILGIIK